MTSRCTSKGCRGCRFLRQIGSLEKNIFVDYKCMEDPKRFAQVESNRPECYYPLPTLEEPTVAMQNAWALTVINTIIASLFEWNVLAKSFVLVNDEAFLTKSLKEIGELAKERLEDDDDD